MEHTLNIPTNGTPARTCPTCGGGPVLPSCPTCGVTYEQWHKGAARRIPVGICLPGERFSSAWVSNWTNLLVALMASGYDPAPLFGYSSNVFVTRASLWFEMTRAAVPMEYVLWVDDDNIVTPDVFFRLMQDLKDHPEADMVAGWCWIEPNEANGVTARPSCGRLKPGYVVDPFDWGELKRAAAEDRLLECQYTGFPVVLMRAGIAAKAGANPFTPVLADYMRWGMSGEDIGFCVHARERGGALILVDPKVKIPHLKTAPIPDPVDQFETVDLTVQPVEKKRRAASRWAGHARPTFSELQRLRPHRFQRAFSLVHATLRFPDGWLAACQAWYDQCEDPDDCEYILCTEEPVELQRSKVPWKHFKLIDNAGRHTACTAYNAAARASRGKLLVQISDDNFPCPRWDAELLKVLPDPGDREAVIWISTGGDDQIMTFSLLTRPYYERYGRMFYPEYWGMYADNDFTDVAKRDGVIIDARHLMFQHKHPLYGTGHWDHGYAWQNRPAAYDHGRVIYEWRKAHDFEDRVKGDSIDTPLYVPPEGVSMAPV